MFDKIVKILKEIAKKIFTIFYIFIQHSTGDINKRAGKKDMYRAEIDEITKSILTQDSPETPKKKTFFEKLFGWLK